MPELLFRNLDHACRSGRMWWINILYSQLIATVLLLTNATTCTFDNSSFIICYICSKTRLKLWRFWKLFMIVKWSTFLCLCWPQNSWGGKQNSYIVACIWWSCAWIFAVCLWECVSNGVVWVCVIKKAALTTWLWKKTSSNYQVRGADYASIHFHSNPPWIPLSAFQLASILDTKGNMWQCKVSCQVAFH